MNRPAAGHQSLRGLPTGFPSQQQIPQSRSTSSRLPPTGKMASNGGTWAFGGGVPMGGAGLGNPRPNPGPMSSFAQTIGGTSQPAANLDMSEFPSLSNNQPQPSQSTWAASGSRNLGPSTNMRLQQQSSIPSQQQTQQPQDDLFSPTSQLSNSQGGFRFGNQSTIGQSSTQPTGVDEFPPLNRNANGEIGQDRGSSLMRNVGFGTQPNGMAFGSSSQPQPNRSNGLLSALSGSNRTPGNRVASPASVSAASNSRSPVGTGNENDSNSFSNTPFGSILQRDDSIPLPTVPRPDGASQQHEDSLPRSHTLDSASHIQLEESHPEVQDPLAGMSAIDRWGLKGFTYMMSNFPDYAGLVSGTDVTHLGFDLNNSETYSNQVYSLWDKEPARPPIPQFSLPECYRVANVAQLESKLTNFNEEALIFMFYSNPGDLHQVLAAHELQNRNWRYHKKLQLWLTKDEMMIPHSLGNGIERGYYTFFDIKTWTRERRELTLSHDDLEQAMGGVRGL